MRLTINLMILYFNHSSQPGYDTDAIKILILEDVSGIFDGAHIEYTYTTAIQGFSAKLSKGAVEKVNSKRDYDFFFLSSYRGVLFHLFHISYIFTSFYILT